MQVKPESSHLLAGLGESTQGEGLANLKIGGGEQTSEFGSLLEQASGKLINEDANESLLNLITSKEVDVSKMSGDLSEEKIIKADEMGKIIKNDSPLSDEEISEKLKVFSTGNPLKTEMPGFQSHEKLTSPELQSQLAMEKGNVKNVKNIKSNESLELKDILNKETAKLNPELKEQAIHPLKKVNSQSSSDFISQLKTAQSKKVSEASTEDLKLENKKSQVNLYGKKQNDLSKNLISLKGEIETSDSASVKPSENNSNQSFGNMIEQAELKLAPKTSAPRPVLDLSNIGTENKVELINKISNYIEQSNIAKTENVDVLVRHEELGTFQISAKKGQVNPDMVDLKINTLSENGRSFFVENEGELLKALNQNGIKVADLKVSSSKDFMGMADMKGQTSDRSFGENSSNQGNSSNQRNFGQNSSGNEDSQRRRNLWQQFSEHQQAYA